MPARLLRFRLVERPYIFLGAICLVSGLVGLVDPSSLGTNLIAEHLGRIAQTLWLGCYALGGGVLLAGTLWPRRARPEMETFGLHAILGGMAINALGSVATRGLGATSSTLISIMFCAWMIQGRLLILRGKR